MSPINYGSMVEPDADSSGGTGSSGGYTHTFDILLARGRRSIRRYTRPWRIAVEARRTVSRVRRPRRCCSFSPRQRRRPAITVFAHSCTHVHLFLDECMPTRAHANVCTHVSRQDLSINDIYELSPDELGRAPLHAVGMLW